MQSKLTGSRAQVRKQARGALKYSSVPTEVGRGEAPITGEWPKWAIPVLAGLALVAVASAAKGKR